MSKKKVIAMAIGGVIALAISLAVHFVHGESKTMTNVGTTVASQLGPGPVMLEGHWHQSKSGMSSIVMDAVISDGTIKITEKTGDISGIYWVGTFSYAKNTSQSFSVVSTANQAEMTGMLASEDDTKTFTYNDGVISYPFSIMGVSTTVYLSLGA